MMKKLFYVVAMACALATQASAAEIVSRAYVPSGPNAVARSFADKLSDFVNVKDKGAKCDGKTDDTAAIQAAVNAGGTVMLPSGVCVVTKVTLGSNMALVGQSDRSELRRKAGASGGPVLFASGVSQLTISNLTVNGNTPATSGGDSNVFVTGSSDVLIDRVRSVNSLLHGISIQSSTDAASHTTSAIRNSIVQNTAQYGIEAQDTGRIVIEGNRIARSASYGILVYGTAAYSVQNATIVGNVVVEAGGSGIAIPFVNGGTALTPGVEEITLTGNSVERSALNGYVIQGRFAVVTGNSASRNGSQTYHQGFVVNVLSVTMTGNTATRNAGVGIDFGDCKRVIASGNLVEESGIIGIEVNSTEDFVVTGNMVVNNNQTGGIGEDASGIQVHLGTGGYTFTGTSTNGVVSNNIVRAGPNQRYGIRVTGDTGNIRLIGNEALSAGSVRDFEILTPSGQFIQYGNTTAAPTYTPAATMTIQQVGEMVYVDAGATRIDNLLTTGGTYQIGRIVILKFNGVATVGNFNATGTGNLYLTGSSNFVTKNGSVLMLVRADGTGWIELSRRP